ncbi:MAG: hypothetical protein EOP09_06165 [Proteobacteria bacterium]|nr:MAG: hypothetical protein EOP09_06165 [Pseudomonadota bacterium]
MTSVLTAFFITLFTTTILSNVNASEPSVMGGGHNCFISSHDNQVMKALRASSQTLAKKGYEVSEPEHADILLEMGDKRFVAMHPIIVDEPTQIGADTEIHWYSVKFESLILTHVRSSFSYGFVSLETWPKAAYKRLARQMKSARDARIASARSVSDFKQIKTLYPDLTPVDESKLPLWERLSPLVNEYIPTCESFYGVTK